MDKGERQAVKVTQKRDAQQWTVKVDGVEPVSVRPGSSIEIGRKPIRPLPDDGYARMDVVDDTRSMSKRHALFQVGEEGSASVRDLNSTNGSYIVRANGELVRLNAGDEFILPTSPLRMQFGDVAVDFIRVHDVSEEDSAPQVADLFDYAGDGIKQEPDASRMSVDDILDLRAGEPTSVFNATQVAGRISRMNAQDARSNGPEDEALSQARSIARDLADANDGHVENPAEQIPVNVGQTEDQKPQPRDLFQDALSETNTGQTTSPTRPEPDAEGEAASSGPTVSVPDGGRGRDGTDAGGPVGRENGSRPPSSANDPDREREASQTGDEQPRHSQADDDQRAAAIEIRDVFGAGRPSSVSRQDVAGDETAVFTPAFEPGSVFERVSQGDFKAHEEIVEVEGLTSDDAKRTGDFTVQFAMARHPQLLPFLAMNPSLYDDLYAWLAAQGNADVDAALSRNTGYEQYRKAVGK